MTVSSLAKMIAGVNKIVVEKFDLETTAKGEQLVIRVRPWKSSQKRCSICGRECPGFDHLISTIFLRCGNLQLVLPGR